MQRKSEKDHRKAGTFRVDRHGKRVDTGGNLTSLPEPPFALNEAATAIYQDEGGQLVAQGILKPTDVRLLATYASEMAVYVQMMETAQNEGIIITLDNGISCTSAARKAGESALKNALAIADKIGISMIGRSRLGIKTEIQTTPRKGTILDLIKQGKKRDPNEDYGAQFLQN